MKDGIYKSSLVQHLEYLKKRIPNLEAQLRQAKSLHDAIEYALSLDEKSRKTNWKEMQKIVDVLKEETENEELGLDFD